MPLTFSLAFCSLCSSVLSTELFNDPHWWFFWPVSACLICSYLKVYAWYSQRVLQSDSVPAAVKTGRGQSTNPQASLVLWSVICGSMLILQHHFDLILLRDLWGIENCQDGIWKQWGYKYILQDWSYSWLCVKRENIPGIPLYSCISAISSKTKWNFFVLVYSVIVTSTESQSVGSVTLLWLSILFNR